MALAELYNEMRELYEELELLRKTAKEATQMHLWACQSRQALRDKDFIGAMEVLTDIVGIHMECRTSPYGWTEFSCRCTKCMMRRETEAWCAMMDEPFGNSEQLPEPEREGDE